MVFPPTIRLIARLDHQSLLEADGGLEELQRLGDRLLPQRGSMRRPLPPVMNVFCCVEHSEVASGSQSGEGVQFRGGVEEQLLLGVVEHHVDYRDVTRSRQECSRITDCT